MRGAGGVDDSEECRGDVVFIGDQRGVEASRGLCIAGPGAELVQDTPEDIVVAVELLRAGIAEVSETGGPGADGGLQFPTCCVGVSQADFEPEIQRVFDGSGGVLSFRGEGEEDMVLSGDFPDLVYCGGGGIGGQFGGVGAVEAGLI